MTKINIDEIFESSNNKTEEQIEMENKKFEEALNKEKSQINLDVLAKLKAKNQEKMKEDVGLDEDEAILAVATERDMPNIVSRAKQVSIDMGIIGVGQAGSRIAEAFYYKGYDVGVINTSSQDLEYINVLPQQKLLLEGTLGGTGKDLDLSRAIFEDQRDKLKAFVQKIADTSEMLWICFSSGGGTGAGSLDTMIPLAFETGLPVGVIFVLPKATEDAQSKKNSIESLSRLARLTASDMVSSLVVVDNARIEQIYGGLSQSEFWKTANNAIVEPIHLFNHLTSQPSKYTSLDPSDFGKIISCGDCSVYGVVEVDDFEEETSLAEAVIESLSSNMLAEGFDLSQTRSSGVIITGSERALSKLPSLAIDYCYHMVGEQTNGAAIYQGVYSDESVGNKIRIYSWFAGLGLPKDRIENLKKESKAQEELLSQKEKRRSSAMTLDLEENKTSSVKDEIHRKLEKKKSGFNKLQAGSRSIIDKRRK